LGHYRDTGQFISGRLSSYVRIAAVLLIVIVPSLVLSQDYIVGERDVLRITVYDNPDLSTLARVSGEGTIQFPLIGEVKVAGLTIQQISKKISKLLSEGYIVNPQVMVFIEEYRSKKATIIGEIVRPGLYELPGPTTLLELLSRAGGITKDAGDKAILKRKSDKGEQSITVNLRKLIEKGDTSLDVTLQDGDSIYVPKAGFFYVTGEVKNPNAYRFEDGTTVIQAISMAGGFTDKAAESRIKIKRKENGQEKTIDKVGFDQRIKPGDVIMVPESIF
jgi:polysaccharide export outer membrane protein